MKISVIVLNYNGLDNTLDCLESLRRLRIDRHLIEIVVVDNNSSDGSQEAFAKLKDIELLVNSENLGFAGGNNRGIEFALKRNADYLLILNNDTIVDRLLVDAFVKAAGSADIVSPKIYFAPGFEFHKKRYRKKDLGKVIWYAGGEIDWQNIIGKHIGVDEVDRGQFSKAQEIDFATGACVFVNRRVFEKIGFFDEKYFLYLEDMDFCVRAKKQGFKILFEPKAVIWHKNAATAGGSGSPTQDYFITRNRLLFAFKHAKFRTKLAVLKQIISQSQDPLKRQALFDFFTLKFGKGSILK